MTSTSQPAYCIHCIQNCNAVTDTQASIKRKCEMKQNNFTFDGEIVRATWAEYMQPQAYVNECGFERAIKGL